ncbi:MAG TPA: S41 family peptidase, partial [Parafilimonas sp.]|nr:S41 family peptidase [Parafilimonas sp.]
HKMATFLETRLQNGSYDSIFDPADFADKLTADLRSIYFDHHLSVHYEPDLYANLNNTTAKQADQAKEEFERAKKANFGFVKVEVLKSNVGFIKFNQFYAVDNYSRETVDAAFKFLDHTNAIIIDLRENIGGEPEMVQLICSYFFDQKVHLNDLFERRTNKTTSFVTTSLPETDLFKNKPLYILTSHGTFSAGEEFAYDLQTLKRAVVVGETTGGGAHPVAPFAITNGFVAFVPYEKAINPVTKTNWEGVGVKPNIETGADSALDVALFHLYDNITKTSKDEQEIASAQWQKNLLGLKLNPAIVDAATLRTYTGNFDGITVSFENDTLYFVTAKGHKSKLIPLSETVMKRSDGDDNDIQIEFVKDQNNAASKIAIHFNDGTSEYFMKKN